MNKAVPFGHVRSAMMCSADTDDSEITSRQVQCPMKPFGHVRTAMVCREDAADSSVAFGHFRSATMRPPAANAAGSSETNDWPQAGVDACTDEGIPFGQVRSAIMPVDD